MQRRGDGDRDKLGPAELAGLRFRPGQVRHAASERVRLAVELQRAVIRDDRIRSDVRCKDVGIYYDTVRGLTPRDDRVNASANMQQIPRTDVLLHDCQAGTRLESPPGLVLGGKALQPEDGVGSEVVNRLHEAFRFLLRRL
jgi:hypothetical protein